MKQKDFSCDIFLPNLSGNKPFSYLEALSCNKKNRDQNYTQPRTEEFTPAAQSRTNDTCDSCDW